MYKFMQEGFNIYTILSIMIAIALAIFSPSMPKINSTINLINGLVIFFIILLLVILLDIYLKERRRKREIENKVEEINKKTELINGEISFLKDRFKTLEDLSTTKAKLELIEKRIFKK